MTLDLSFIINLANNLRGDLKWEGISNVNYITKGHHYFLVFEHVDCSKDFFTVICSSPCLNVCSRMQGLSPFYFYLLPFMHIFPNAQVTKNKMAKKKKNIFSVTFRHSELHQGCLNAVGTVADST